VKGIFKNRMYFVFPIK